MRRGVHARHRELRRLRPVLAAARAAIAATLGSGGGKGTRSVATFDEDTTSLGVEAARIALRAAPGGDAAVATCRSATTEPAYLDKTNANAIHAALALPSSVPAPTTSSARCARTCGVQPTPPASAAGWPCCQRHPHRPARRRPTRPTAATPRWPSLFGDGPEVIAETIGGATATGEFLDRWRTPGDAHSPPVGGALRRARLPAPGRGGRHRRARSRPASTAADLDHVIVTGLPTPGRGQACGQGRRRPARGLRRRPVGVSRQHRRRPLRPAPGRRARPGRAGPDHRRRHAGRRLRRLAAAHHRRHRRPRGRRRRCRSSSAATRDDLTYAPFLTWRGFLRREPPRRPEPDRPAAPPSAAHARRGSTASSAAGTRPASSTCPPSRVSAWRAAPSTR